MSVQDEGLTDAVLSAIRESVAAVDRHGRVKWANSTWLRIRNEEGRDTLAAVAVGMSYVDVARANGGPNSSVIAHGVNALLAGECAYFELEYQLHAGDERWFFFAGTPLPQRGGAVLIQHELRSRIDEVPGAVRSTSDASPHAGMRGRGAPIEEPTARERQVLDLLVRGYDNRAIAAELAIGYTTVRGHVRALIAKVGARSRIELVALAYQRGLVSRTGG